MRKRKATVVHSDDEQEEEEEHAEVPRPSKRSKCARVETSQTDIDVVVVGGFAVFASTARHTVSAGLIIDLAGPAESCGCRLDEDR